MSEMTIVVKVTQAIVKTSLIESIRDGIVDFLVDQAKDLGKKEISDRIAKLRSDAKLRKQIQQAMKRAVERWATDCPEYKVTAVQIAPASHRSTWQEEFAARAEQQGKIAETN